MKTLRFLPLLMLIPLMMVSSDATAQKRKDRKALFANNENYEITTVKIGQEGTKFVKVWGYAKKKDQAVVQAKKNAVHACIFRGLPASSNASSTPPICTDPNAWENHSDYFEKFFETGGAYIAYVNQTTDGMPAGTDQLKIKGGYKVGIYAQVMYDNLKKRLIADGIVRGLNSGF